MPNINRRLAGFDSMEHRYEPAPVTTSPIYSLPVTDSIAPINNPPTNSNLMSITSGNTVPMRGILPVEQMSDADIAKFFPYSAYQDRIPKYTYYQLFNAI